MVVREHHHSIKLPFLVVNWLDEGKRDDFATIF